MQKTQFINEKSASELFGIKPRTLRRKVKAGEYPVPFRTRPSGKGFFYDRISIEKILNENSSQIIPKLKIA